MAVAPGVLLRGAMHDLESIDLAHVIGGRGPIVRLKDSKVDHPTGSVICTHIPQGPKPVERPGDRLGQPGGFNADSYDRYRRIQGF